MAEPQHVVLGAGAVGLTVAHELHRRGRRVAIVNRSGVEAPPGAETMRGDIADHDFARMAGENASHIYNCVNPPYDRWPQQWPRLNAGVLAAAEVRGAKLIVISNLYVYGRTGGTPITEAMPHNAHTVKGRVRAEIDRQSLEADAAGRYPVAILRASDFFGPHTRKAVAGAPVFDRLVRGKAPQFIGDPDMPHTYSYVPDVARAMVDLGERDDVFGQEWLVPSPPTLTTREFIRRAAAACDAPDRLQVMPRLAMRVLSLAVPMLRELREMTYQFEEPYQIDDGKFRAAFPGFAPTPWEEALQATAAWFRNHPPRRAARDR